MKAIKVKYEKPLAKCVKATKVKTKRHWLNI